jgi:hypothetical protein
MRFTTRLAALAALSILAGCVGLAAAQGTPPGEPVSMLITLEARRGKQVAPVEPADLKVSEAGGNRPITELASLRGSSLQLLVLIDNSSQSSFDTEIGTLKQWVNSLATNTQIAIAYMQNGMAVMSQNFTADHAAAAKSIRLTMGRAGADVSPYDSLSDAIKKWPQNQAKRREVLMISSGVEGLGGGIAPENPYVNKGIADAQRAGIAVYTIYNPAAGHFGHTLWRISYGQNFLSQLSDETGGEAYITTLSAPVSFQPFLENFSMQLENQYQLTFVAKPEKKSGLQPVKITVPEKTVDVVAASKVFVKASL